MTIEQLADLSELVDHFPDPTPIDPVVKQRLETINWPGDITLLRHLIRWQDGQGGGGINLRRPRLAIYAARHAMAEADGIITQQDIKNQIADHANETSMTYHLCAQVDADLRLYELDLDSINQDPRGGDGDGNGDGGRMAMDEQTATHALAYGMMAVEPGVGLLAPAVMDHARPSAKMILDKIDETGDPLELLCRYGAPDLAAGLGAMIAARMAGCPVVIDNIGMLAMAAVLSRMADGAGDHCAVLSVGDSMVAYAEKLDLPMIVPILQPSFGPGENVIASIPTWRVMVDLLN